MIDRVTPRSAILVVAGAVVLVALVGWFALVSPQRQKAADLQDEITALEARLGLAERIVADDEPAKRAVEVRRLAVAMPEEVGMPQLLRQMSEASRRANVRINGVTPAVPAAAGTYQAVPMSLALDGHYFGIANFLQFLRTKAVSEGELIVVNGRLYSVDSITFSGSGSTAGDSGRISATVALNAYTYVAAPVSVPSAATADTTGSAVGTND
jgi:Tfp pilus assembly protein PilO